MGIVLVILAIGFVLVALPGIWVSRILDTHARDRDDFHETGAEFARAALDRLNLRHVKVEVTEQGNHYDPDAKAVRLEPRFMTGRSLSAVVVAAHEVGHAMQHAMDLPMFSRRLKIAKQAHVVNLIGQGFVWTAPILLIVGKAALAMMFNVAGFILTALLSFALQVVTLPVEFDASFKRALPLLERGQFIPSKDMPAARAVLRAAAFTYVAALIRSILTIPIFGRGVRP
jgi:uncharacterized protein